VRQQTLSPVNNEDLVAQQVLAQEAVGTLLKQQDRIKELEALAASNEAELERKNEELKKKGLEVAPAVSGEPTVSSKEIIAYLEDEILPKARNGNFSGAVPVMKSGKMEIRKVSSLSELEELIKDLKTGASQMAAASLPTTNLPSSGFLSKLKSLVGG